MKTFVTVLLAALIGAVGFHLYYLSASRDERCTIDHRFGWRSSDACRMHAAPAQYDRDAQKRLDALIDDVQ
ncbi:hypothetical protein [Sphingomonas prati]|uniref:Uncharacterized protein n=1 Tax=Sphingomonas prati TaxID=1843237 RepID=A0A7W9BR63_9SPHN|nr:hypothetical protein [Sphingomonas prati]MBB5728624.1 hypothetical protein [Sphingomonas prati]GGE72332.1 hypothetical protein GCM10011404_01030 [Sphingomonas prati]